MSFSDLELAEPLLKAVAASGYELPTPIQSQAIPLIVAGRDVLGSAQTGTGKTAAFALPILHRMITGPDLYRGRGRKIRVLVLSPTRELALQIGDSFATYGRHTPYKHVVVSGGVNQFAQVKALRQGVDILVATPGRLFDLMQQGFIDLRAIEVFVLDEADRMLDMGFLPDIRRVIPYLPAQRQSLFFSATMPADIRQLADSILRDPATVTVKAASAAADTVEQAVYLVGKKNKPQLLKHVLRGEALGRTLVFTRTKHGADRVTQQLIKSGIRCDAIHGDKTQASRQRALATFRQNKMGVLVATDVASRGLDINDISHVVNYDMPLDADTYVHRIGRTGRAGAAGKAISFCSVEERSQLRDVERLLKRRLPVLDDQPKYEQVDPAEQNAPVYSGEATGGAAQTRRDPSRKPGRRPSGGRPPFAGAQSGGKPPFRKFGQNKRRGKPSRALSS